MAKQVKQIYVVLRRQFHGVNVNGQWITEEDTPLGFAAEYNENSARCIDKNKKQDVWAGHTLQNGILVERKSDYINGKYIQRFDPIPLDLYPKVYDNVPLDGFKIASTVSRYSTSNKLWRILDPRGFELEISTDNMETILKEGTIIKGVLQGKFNWDFGKNGIGKAKLVQQ